MKLASVAPMLVLGATGVLFVAVWSLRGERARLLDEFAATQQSLAQDLASDASTELAGMDEDARLVAGLVAAARGQGALDAAGHERSVLTAFQALTTVVRHYRSIALVDRDGHGPTAVDPTLPASVSDQLRAWVTEAGRALAAGAGPLLLGPREVATRQFYVYAAPADVAHAIVLVTEARLLVQPLLRPRGGHVRTFLVDPAMALWSGCDRPSSCRAMLPAAWQKHAGLAAFMRHIQDAAGRAWSAGLGSTMNLPDRPAVVAWASFQGPAARRWWVGVVASDLVLDARERSLMRRLLVTSAALAVALGAIALFLVRRQRAAAALEERLKHTQVTAHLRERSEKIVENVPVGLLGVAADGRVVLANRFAVERSGGVSAGAALDQMFPEADTTSVDRLRAAIDTAVNSGRPAFLRDDELRLYGARPGHHDYRVIPLRQPSDDMRALVLIEDLSELKSLEMQLVRAEKLVTVGVLAAGLAHEIGTPLGIIRVRAETLLDKVADPALARDLESVIRQIDQIAATIHQVLDFSRAQAVDVRPVSAVEAVDAATALLDWRFRGKNLKVQVDAAPSLRPVAADPDQIQQVLVNLLLNACDACAEGGTITVRLRDDTASDRLRMDVQDDGCGIAPEHLNAVFDPFFTTKKRGEGTGLGLPVAASIVRNHGGDIGLTSRPGLGTTVTLLWPAANRAA